METNHLARAPRHFSLRWLLIEPVRSPRWLAKSVHPLVLLCGVIPAAVLLLNPQYRWDMILVYVLAMLLVTFGTKGLEWRLTRGARMPAGGEVSSGPQDP